MRCASNSKLNAQTHSVGSQSTLRIRAHSDQEADWSIHVNLKKSVKTRAFPVDFGTDCPWELFLGAGL